MDIKCFSFETKNNLNYFLFFPADSGPYFHIDSEISLGHDVYDELTITIDDPNNDRFIRNDIDY